MLANKMKIKDLEMQKKIVAQRNFNQNNRSPGGSRNSNRSDQSKNNDLLNIISGKTYLHNGTILGPGRFGVKANQDILESVEIVEGIAFKDGEIAIEGVTVEDLQRNL